MRVHDSLEGVGWRYLSSLLFLEPVSYLLKGIHNDAAKYVFSNFPANRPQLHTHPYGITRSPTTTPATQQGGLFLPIPLGDIKTSHLETAVQEKYTDKNY